MFYYINSTIVFKLIYGLETICSLEVYCGQDDTYLKIIIFEDGVKMYNIKNA